MTKIKICGIYKIINIINGKVYIGQSVDIESRWHCHKHYLNNNKHYSNHLQRAWNKYGKENFKFEIIEECDKDSLDEKEIYYIEKYNSFKDGYNQSLGGDILFHTDETKSKISKANKGKKRSKETILRMSEVKKGKKASDETKLKMSKLHHTNKKKIIQFDTEGKIIKIWNDELEIRNELKIDTRSIRGCCKHEAKRRTYKSCIWMYYDEYIKKGLNIDNYMNKGTQKRKIVQLDLENNYIATWDTISEASKTLNIADWTISFCCKGKKIKASGYKWMYFKDYELMLIKDVQLQ